MRGWLPAAGRRTASCAERLRAHAACSKPPCTTASAARRVLADPLASHCAEAATGVNVQSRRTSLAPTVQAAGRSTTYARPSRVDRDQNVPAHPYAPSAHPARPPRAPRGAARALRRARPAAPNAVAAARAHARVPGREVAAGRARARDRAPPLPPRHRAGAAGPRGLAATRAAGQAHRPARASEAASADGPNRRHRRRQRAAARFRSMGPTPRRPTHSRGAGCVQSRGVADLVICRLSSL